MNRTEKIEFYDFYYKYTVDGKPDQLYSRFKNKKEALQFVQDRINDGTNNLYEVRLFPCLDGKGLTLSSFKKIYGASRRLNV